MVLNAKITEAVAALDGTAAAADEVYLDEYWVTEAEKIALREAIDTAKAVSGNPAANGGGVYQHWGTFSKTGGTIYGYTPGDSLSNVVKIGDTVQDKLGHAVYAIGYYTNTINRRETTAGEDDALTWDWNNENPIVTGDWE
jgi:hypothetical protein